MSFRIGQDWPLGFLTLAMAGPIVMAILYIGFDGGGVFTDLRDFLRSVLIWALAFAIGDRFRAWKASRAAVRGTRKSVKTIHTDRYAVKIWLPALGGLVGLYLGLVAEPVVMREAAIGTILVLYAAYQLHQRRSLPQQADPE